MGDNETSHRGEIAMSPDTRAAIANGKPLNKRQFREYIEYEAKQAGIKGGADEAIKRAERGASEHNYREMRLRLSINTYIKA